MTMMDRQTADFIAAHRDDDVRHLALCSAGYTGVDMPFALNQIAGRQAARRKLPTWASTDGIIYPPHISMEQCSSETTAVYKAVVARRLVAEKMKSADTGSNTEKANRDTVFVDITGGFGVDFSFIARLFGRSVYIERQQHLCDIAEENFQRLGIDTAEVVCGDCEEWLRCNTGMHADLIMADPARRDAHGGRTFAISDCTPEVTALKELLLDKADYIMIKLSPMLDWHKAAEDFGPEVREIHIISTGNECKELLIVASRYGEKTDEDKYVNKSRPRLFCVNDSTVVEVTAAGCGTDMSESDVKTPVKPVKDLVFSTPLYLYEPNASIMKAGCFDIIEQRYHVRQIDKSSHLFVSDSPVNNFPGRKFSVTGITTMNKKELRKTLGGIDKANITTRNFPLTVAELRHRLKMKEGGDKYIFATTMPDKSHVLLICTKND